MTLHSVLCFAFALFLFHHTSPAHAQVFLADDRIYGTVFHGEQMVPMFYVNRSSMAYSQMYDLQLDPLMRTFYFLHSDGQQQVISKAPMRGPMVNEDRFDTRTHNIPTRGFTMDYQNNFAYYSQPMNNQIWRANLANKDMGSRDVAFIPGSNAYQIVLDTHRGVLYYAQDSTDLWQLTYDAKNKSGMGFFHSPTPIAVGWTDQATLLDIEIDQEGNTDAVYFCNYTHILKFDFQANRIKIVWVTGGGISSFVIDTRNDRLYVLEGAGIFARKLSNPDMLLDGFVRPTFYSFEDRFNKHVHLASSVGLVLFPDFLDLDRCRQPPDELYLNANTRAGTCPSIPYTENGVIVANGTSCEIFCVLGMVRSADFYDQFTKTCINGLFNIVPFNNISAMCVDAPHTVIIDGDSDVPVTQTAGFIVGMVFMSLALAGMIAYGYIRWRRAHSVGAYNNNEDEPLAASLRKNRDGSLNFTQYTDNNDD